MSRQRMVKPEFFDSESLAECSIAARLAFIGLWVEADDYGRLKAQPMRLKQRIFPYDRMTPAKFTALLRELEKVGCIKGYEVDGDTYIEIPNFGVYQTVNRPSKSNIPEPSEKVRKMRKTNVFSEYSVSTHAKERKKEGRDRAIEGSIPKEAAVSAAAAEESAPLPADDHCYLPACRKCGSKVEPTTRGGGFKWVCPQCGVITTEEVTTADFAEGGAA